MISVIIPVYNHAHTLKRCLDSLLVQTYRPIEIIIVNDGSTDNFEEVVSLLPLPEGEHRGGGSIKVLSQSNLGASVARNTGFAQSKGEYVIFWDADTMAKPDMLGKMHQSLQNNPQASYAYCKYKFGWKKIKSHEFSPELLKKLNYIDTTSLIRRSALSPSFQEGVGGVAEVLDSPLGRGRGGLAQCPFAPPLKRFQDWDLWLTLLEKNKTGVFIPEILYKKIIGARKGISSWLPSFFYRFPFFKKVKKYEEAKEIVLKKHKLV